MRARNTFDLSGNHSRPGTAPRFRNAGIVNVRAAQDVGDQSAAILCECGFTDDEIRSLRQREIVA
jgi:crotonobetainyl-CoA:carnitine CoA-transferase CaiB-like acyl-CoA transferase